MTECHFSKVAGQRPATLLNKCRESLVAISRKEEQNNEIVFCK